MMREYKKYDEYKDSGIEWLGDIPNKWDKITLKNIANFISGNGFPLEYQGFKNKDIYFAKVSDINQNNMFIKKANNTVNKLEAKNNNWNIIDKNSILAAKIGEALKMNHRKINTVKMCIDNNMIAIVPINIYIYYLYYLFLIIDFNWYSNMGAIPSLNVRELSNSTIFLPSLKEQKKIANFLDKKTAEIDEIINKKESLIEKLENYKKSVITEAVTKGKLGDKYINEDGELVDEIEMKDSGVEWIGEIPNYMKFTKLKYFIEIIDGDRGSEYPSENECIEKGVLFLSTNNIKNNKFDFNNNRYITPEKFMKLKRGKLQKNDLVITVRGTIGATALFDSCKYKTAFINAQMMILRPIKIDPKVLYYLTLTKMWKNQLDSLSYGAAQKQLSNGILSNIIIVIPRNRSIENEIIKYLDCKINEIELLIQKTKESIEKYKDYKKSLIFEAVTGKIDLRDYQLEEV